MRQRVDSHLCIGMILAWFEFSLLIETRVSEVLKDCVKYRRMASLFIRNDAACSPCLFQGSLMNRGANVTLKTAPLAAAVNSEVRTGVPATVLSRTPLHRSFQVHDRYQYMT